MPAYARHCDHVAVVKSVSDLAGLADELLPA